jgi:hypothetical protein
MFALSEPRTAKSSFAIHPPVRTSDGQEIRSLGDAKARVRRYVRRSGDFIGMRLVSLLENARTAEQAELAAEAFRHWAVRGQIASQEFSKRNWQMGTARKASPRHA